MCTGPLLVLVSPCFRENVVVTCKIGSFLCSLDNLLQWNVFFFFLGNQLSTDEVLFQIRTYDVLYSFLIRNDDVLFRFELTTCFSDSDWRRAFQIWTDSVLFFYSDWWRDFQIRTDDFRTDDFSDWWSFGLTTCFYFWTSEVVFRTDEPSI